MLYLYSPSSAAKCMSIHCPQYQLIKYFNYKRRMSLFVKYNQVSVYNILFHCFKALENSCYLKWMWIQIVKNKKTQILTGEMWNILYRRKTGKTVCQKILTGSFNNYFPCRSCWNLCNSISWWCHESYRRCIKTLILLINHAFILLCPLIPFSTFIFKVIENCL